MYQTGKVLGISETVWTRLQKKVSVCGMLSAIRRVDTNLLDDKSFDERMIFMQLKSCRHHFQVYVNFYQNDSPILYSVLSEALVIYSIQNCQNIPRTPRSHNTFSYPEIVNPKSKANPAKSSIQRNI